VPTLDQSKAFPPRFEKGILYPAIYNLDQLDMTGAPVGDSAYPGLYFDLTFNGFAGGEIPELTFGKHAFELRHSIAPTEYVEDDVGGYWDPSAEFPPLRPGSRILFEFKDENGLVIYSDIISGYKLTAGNGFRGFVWLKVDPLRTHGFIKEGNGTATFVGETIVARNNTNWRGTYNVRTTFPIKITLTEPVEDDEGNVNYEIKENSSPLFMKYKPTHMGSGSGLFISESREMTGGINDSYLAISASKLQTYGGKIGAIDIDMKFKYIDPVTNNSTISDWIPVNASFPLAEYSNIYENFIDEDYSDGLNPTSFVTPPAGSSSAIPIPIAPSDVTSFDARFRFRFKDSSANQNYAQNYLSTVSGSFKIFYPSGSENTNEGWMSWGGGDKRTANTTFAGSSRELHRTSDGHFIFTRAPFSVKTGFGGQKADSSGRLIQYGRPGSKAGGSGGTGGGSGPVN
jgi:hypothetical protein